MINTSLQKSCTKWGNETSSRPFFVFLKSFVYGKSKYSAASFQYIPIALKLTHNKNKLKKTLDYWSRDIPNFDFLEKRLRIVSPPHFVHYFSRKMFFMLYLTDCLYFLRYWWYCNMCIAFVCFSGCDVVNFEINLIFLVKLFSTSPKNQNKGLNLLRKKTAFKVK